MVDEMPESPNPPVNSNTPSAGNPETAGHPAYETLKFVLRLALLIGVPLLISQSADFTGVWKTLFEIALPILLPIIDKYIHQDPNIPAKGLLPF